MNKIILFLILLLNISKLAFGQITLEHSYPNASVFISNPNQQQLYLVKLEVDGEKYVHIDRINKEVIFYNLNHTFFKSISFSGTTDLFPNGNFMSILYISQNLFDNDDEIEFLYVDQNHPNAITQIVNEDGSIIFTENNAAPNVKLNVPQQQVPIYNTVNGTKMILSLNTGEANVYSLPGTLTTMTVINIENQVSEIVLYPNPSKNEVTVKSYNVPINKINIVDLNGKTIQTIDTNNVFQLDINTNNLNPSEYLIQIIDSQGSLIELKKIIVN